MLLVANNLCGVRLLLFRPLRTSARKAFMQSGLLQRVQELRLSAGPKVAESISRINAAFPTECVKFSDPSYARELVAKLEE